MSPSRTSFRGPHKFSIVEETSSSISGLSAMLTTRVYASARRRPARSNSARTKADSCGGTCLSCEVLSELLPMVDVLKPGRTHGGSGEKGARRSRGAPVRSWVELGAVTSGAVRRRGEPPFVCRGHPPALRRPVQEGSRTAHLPRAGGGDRRPEHRASGSPVQRPCRTLRVRRPSSGDSSRRPVLYLLLARC